MNKPISQKNILGIILLGSVLETYDYSLFGYFAAILTQKFFPAQSMASGLLLTFTVFAIGFIARPIGALVFGHYGDKYGRKKTLIITIMLMAVPTACIGFLPTYATIGIYAGLLLTLCRLMQGIAVGAEFVGTMVYMVELAPPEKRSFYGSLCICSGYLAMLMTAIVVALLTHFLSSADLQQWGWRLAFIFGLVLGFLGIVLRSKMPETNAFKFLQIHQAISARPFIDLIKTSSMQVMQAIGLSMFHVAGFYILFVYLTTYLQGHYHFSSTTSVIVNFIAITCGLLCLPVFGMLADRVNKKSMIIVSTFMTMISTYLFFVMLAHESFAALLFMEISLVILVCMTSAVLPAFLADMFPTKVRYTGMALSYNVAAVIFGGGTPLILTLIVEKSGQIAAPSYYLIFAAMITLLCALISKKQHE